MQIPDQSVVNSGISSRLLLVTGLVGCLACFIALQVFGFAFGSAPLPFGIGEPSESWKRDPHTGVLVLSLAILGLLCWIAIMGIMVINAWRTARKRVRR
jgi:hypothetical protein